MANENSIKPIDSSASDARSVVEIQDWLVNLLAEELQVAPDKIKLDQSILVQGVDSIHAVAILAKLEDWLGFRFTSDPLEDSPSVETLAVLAQRDRDQPSRE